MHLPVLSSCVSHAENNTNFAGIPVKGDKEFTGEPEKDKMEVFQNSIFEYNDKSYKSETYFILNFSILSGGR